MKRIALFLAVLACVATLPSCGMAKSLVGGGTRMVQSAVRTVGL